MSENAPEFSLFNHLPFEIRAMIWRFSLPGPQVVELDSWAYKESDAPPYERERLVKLSTLPPIAFVCRESRKIVLRDYYCTWKDPTMPQLGFPIRSRVCFRPAVDMLHINWANRREQDMPDHPNGPDVFRNYVRCIIERAKERTGLRTLPPLSTGTHWIGPALYKMLDELWKIQCFDRILLCEDATVAFHLPDPQSATGLMEELVRGYPKCVHLLDAETIEEFHRLSLLHGYKEDYPTSEFFLARIWKDQRTPTAVTTWMECRKNEWVNSTWLDARWKGYPDLPRIEDVFNPLRHPLYPDQPLYQYSICNAENPWVQECLRNMPRVQPGAMFRYCPFADCIEDFLRSDTEH